MKSVSYNGRDYASGQAMLRLRRAVDLTQAELADIVGVSRSAVGKWERGSSYPICEHLKQMIELGVKQQAFPVGHEAEEVHTLWQVTHQREHIDKQWLSRLLSQQSSPSPRVAPRLQLIKGATTTMDS